jgi:hypothetical protein
MRAYEVFAEMRDRNLTASLRSWSQEWLDRAQNFGATHQSEPLPPETAITLRCRLIEAGHHDLAAKVLLTMLGEYEKPRRQPRRSR